MSRAKTKQSLNRNGVLFELTSLLVAATVSCTPAVQPEGTTPVNEESSTEAASTPAPQSASLPEPEALPTDSNIESAVRTELIYADEVLNDNIDVSCSEGILTLAGTVDSVLGKDAAIRLAGMVRGVRSIVDQLQVREIEINEETLQERVADALLFDPAIDSTVINVNVRDNTVELTGQVPTWQQNRLVEHVVGGVRGVAAIDNDLDLIALEPRTDAEIHDDITARLRTERWLDEELLSVSVSGGEVNVSGIVGSESVRRLAYECAWVPGVQDVEVDDIEIEPWAENEMRRAPNERRPLSNEEVAQAVRDAFVYDPRVFSFEPTVIADDGVVTLMGSVTSIAAKRAATETALNTIGVYHVRNQLQVEPAIELSPEDLEPRIRQVLSWNPYVERHEITVDVVGPRAYLYGSVDSSFEREEAERVVSTVSGVTAVSNRIEVRDDYVETPMDGIVEQEIASLLYWSPWVNSNSIEVSVEGGTATLTGTLEDWRAYVSAVNKAYQGGAERVVTRVSIIEPTPSYFVD